MFVVDFEENRQYSPHIGADYRRGRLHLAPPMLSFPILFLWHQRGKWKWKKKKKGSSVFWEDCQAFIENGASSQKFWSGWAAVWGVEVIQMFVPFWINFEFFPLIFYQQVWREIFQIPQMYFPMNLVKVVPFSRTIVFIYAFIDRIIPKTICKYR